MPNRFYSKRKPELFGLLALVLVFPQHILSQAPTGMAYVSDGTTASRVTQSEIPACDHWEIWLFRNNVYVSPYGAAGNTSAHWGTIDGSSEAIVEEKLKKAQAFDKAWVRFAGAGYNPATDLNAENPMGPICITSQPSPAAQQRRQQANQMSGTLQTLENAAQAVWATEPGPNEELRGYLETLDAMQQTQARIFRMLDNHIVNLAMLDNEMQQWNQQEASAQQMATNLRNIPPPASTIAAAGPPSLGNWINVNIPDRDYIQTMSRNGNEIQLIVDNTLLHSTYTDMIPLNGIKSVGKIDSTDPGNGVDDGNIWFFIFTNNPNIPQITVVFPNIAQAQQAHDYFAYYAMHEQ
jgi:hypothetical protein